ncbi:MAG: triose-phosphate isomerase [Bacillota bacterium]
MRKPFICGNWKMNKTVSEAKDLVSELKDLVADVDEVEVGVCPPAIDLVAVKEILENSDIKVGAQNMHWEESGAYTGELSGPMLEEINLDYVILGHSERREYFAETDEDVNKKVKSAFEHNLKPIICVGESLKERKEGKAKEKVKTQVEKALEGLDKEKVKNLVIAYEPLWAIGTGESASAEEAEEMIAYIRKIIEKNYFEAAKECRIQYGGSVKPHNVDEFMSQKNIDGALVGGASLKAKDFAGVVKNF